MPGLQVGTFFAPTVLLFIFLLVISLHFMAKLFFITKTRKLESTKFRPSFFRAFVIRHSKIVNI